MVIDHVHRQAQAVVVKRLHHRAELAHAGDAVWVACIAVVGRAEVQRVVAPVEAVGVARGADDDLRLVAIRRVAGGVGRWRATEVPIVGFFPVSRIPR